MNQTRPAELADNAFASCAETVARTARELAALGWAPATSGNFSMRVGPTRAAITISGRDKRTVGPDDIMLIDLDGQPVNTSARPSAETALHTQLYRHSADITAVLHTHSHVQSVASRLFAGAGAIRLQGWELQKAIGGCTTHAGVLELPVFPNTQHMPELVAQVAAWLGAGKPLHAYLIAGHGMYTWGDDMPEARRQLEALEFLLDCELDLRRLQGS